MENYFINYENQRLLQKNRRVVDIPVTDSDGIKIMLLESAHDVVNVWKVILPEDEHLHTKLDTYSLFNRCSTLKLCCILHRLFIN